MDGGGKCSICLETDSVTDLRGPFLTQEYANQHSKEDTMTAEIKKKKNALKAVPTDSVVDNQAIYEIIAKKAYELYEKRGGQHGHDLEDWIEAERSVLSNEKTDISA